MHFPPRKNQIALVTNRYSTSHTLLLPILQISLSGLKGANFPLYEWHHTCTKKLNRYNLFQYSACGVFQSMEKPDYFTFFLEEIRRENLKGA